LIPTSTACHQCSQLTTVALATQCHKLTSQQAYNIIVLLTLLRLFLECKLPHRPGECSAGICQNIQTLQIPCNAHIFLE